MNRKHLILMIVGCSLPIVALGAIWLFQLELSTPLLFALLLLCPLSHLRGHGHGGQQAAARSPEEHSHG